MDGSLGHEPSPGGRSPAIRAEIWRAVSFVISVRVSHVAPPLWGARITLSIVKNSGLGAMSGDPGGSCQKKSSAAPAIVFVCQGPHQRRLVHDPAPRVGSD